MLAAGRNSLLGPCPNRSEYSRFFSPHASRGNTSRARQNVYERSPLERPPHSMVDDKSVGSRSRLVNARTIVRTDGAIAASRPREGCRYLSPKLVVTATRFANSE